jgi:hypothetical protein
MALSIQRDSFEYLAMTGRLHACVAALLAALVVGCSTSSTIEPVTDPGALKPLRYPLRHSPR